MILPKVPRGLLEIIRARAGGKAPDQLSETVVPTIDTLAMYGADLITGFVANAGPGAVSQQVNLAMTALTAPGRAIGLSGLCTLGAAAGTQLRLSLGIAHTNGSQFHIFATEVYTAPQAGQGYRVAVLFPYPFVFNPGSTFLFLTSGDAGGADHTMQAHLLFENYSPFL